MLNNEDVYSWFWDLSNGMYLYHGVAWILPGITGSLQRAARFFDLLIMCGTLGGFSKVINRRPMWYVATATEIH